jgi:hypothetical protein
MRKSPQMRVFLFWMLPRSLSPREGHIAFEARWARLRTDA